MSMLPQHVARYEDMVTGLDPYPATKLTGLDAPRAADVPVEETVLPDPAEEDDGVSMAWVGGAGAAVLFGAGALGLRRRRRLR
jgi:MYXO-CTERM domain-containing protein